MAQNKMELDIINLHAAGIDIGSRSHFVAVGQSLQDVKEFGVYADDLTAICLHLKEHKITSVAMESTGSYWQNLYVELIKHGFDVTLCNGKFTKNIKGKKTDVKDARWIQKLHSIGLLTGSFLPDDSTETLRTYCRQRTNWVQLSMEATHKMQKYLKLLNFRLDVVVRDVCGLTGLAIIADICNGNLDLNKLAEHRHGNCKKSYDEIAKALKGNNRKDYLFGLKQEYWSSLVNDSGVCSYSAEMVSEVMKTLLQAAVFKFIGRPNKTGQATGLELSLIFCWPSFLPIFL